MNSAIIVAAGKANRMGGVDKVFMSLAGKPLLLHTWQKFDQAPSIHQLIFVLRKEAHELFRQMSSQFSATKPFLLAEGGAERQDSVQAGLAQVSMNSELVAIHDGARPCVAVELIEETLAEASRSGAAVAACKITDTLKRSQDGLHIDETVDRQNLWSVQTPQAFHTGIIRRALEAAASKGLKLTDDTAACELIGQKVSLVESKWPNPKVTTPADVPLIEALLQTHRSQHNYPLDKGCSLMLTPGTSKS